ncbi:MAG: hypothetical protein B6240_14940, partial [Desulfobacteraceae bacterium 4572_87]
FTPKLGWSVSRYNLFETCKRQYYYNYYPKYDPEYPAKKILALKNMTSIPLEIGNIVHDVNKTLLERLQKTAKNIDKGKFHDYAKKMTARYVQAKTFQEVHYGRMKSVGPNDLFDKIRISLNNLLNSNRFDWLIEHAVIKKDEWLIEPPGYRQIRKETAHMNEFCQNIQKNIPKDKKHFIPTKSRLCNYCNFKGLCE